MRRRRKTRYNLWSDRSFRESGPREKWQDKDARVVWSTWQYSWEDACQARYTYEGRGRYRPIWEDVSGSCWDGIHKKCSGKRLDRLRECWCSCHKKSKGVIK